MIEKIVRDAKGNDVGSRYYISKDGKVLAQYRPQMEEKFGTNKFGKKFRIQRGHGEELWINTYRTRFGGSWWEKSYLERIKPEYKEELEELIKMYPNARLSEYSDV